MENRVLVTGASTGLGRALVETLDLAQPKDFAQWAEAVRQFGPFLAIIHNAGIQVDKRLRESSDAEIMQEITVNLTAPILLTRLLLPSMAADGHIVMVG